MLRQVSTRREIELGKTYTLEQLSALGYEHVPGSIPLKKMVNKLIRGNWYVVELFPKQTKLNVQYCGKREGKHVFSNDHRYVIVDDHFISEIGGVITHNPLSSFSIIDIKKNELNEIKDSKLIRALRDFEST